MFETNRPLCHFGMLTRLGLSTNITSRIRWPAVATVLPLYVIGFLVIVLAACTEPVPVEDSSIELAQPQGTEKRSTEFVVCIDNSRSIKPPERVLIREATMLLADLADPGDRISVITFGEAARLVVSTTIQSDKDRRTFKEMVRSQVDFAENYSDIRAGLRLLAEQREQLFPKPDAVHAAILFSDGRLEPRDGDTQAAFQQIQDDLEGPLAGLELYSVVLGETYSQRAIDRLGFNGQTLMQQYIARSPNYFYHAKQLDQLFEVAVLILKKTKGISSLGEEGGDRFRIDKTVQSMTLIVRKRLAETAEASGLPVAEEIRLEPPKKDASVATGSSPESIYRNSDYQHFDLFVVRNPRPGIWRVALDSGASPVVMSKIDSPINLMVEARDNYYRNESASLQTWLINALTGTVERGDYQLRARVAPPGGLASSETYVSLTRDEATGQFFIAMPGGLQAAFPEGELPEVAAVEIVAQSDTDPWFLRRSDPFEVAFKVPLIHWTLPGPVDQRLPGLTNQLTFGGDFNEALYQETGFEVLPKLTLTVERYDEETRRYEPYHETTQELVVTDKAHSFRIPLGIAENGRFRYSYRLAGNSEARLVRIRSPWAPLRVEPNWPLLAAIGAVLLVLLHLLGALMARLHGQVQIEVKGVAPGFATAAVRSRRVFDSVSVSDIDLGTARFRVQAKRYLLIFKRLKFMALAGNTILDKQALRPGGTRLLRARGRHEATIMDDEGREINVEMTLR